MYGFNKHKGKQEDMYLKNVFIEKTELNGRKNIYQKAENMNENKYMSIDNI